MAKPAKRVHLHLRLRIAPERRSSLVQFLARAIPVYESPGEIRVRLCVAGEFLEIVEYETEDAYEADQRRVERDPQLRALLAEWRSLLLENPQVETYTEITDQLESHRTHM